MEVRQASRTFCWPAQCSVASANCVACICRCASRYASQCTISCACTTDACKCRMVQTGHSVSDRQIYRATGLKLPSGMISLYRATFVRLWQESQSRGLCEPSLNDTARKNTGCISFSRQLALAEYSCNKERNLFQTKHSCLN